MTSMLLFLCFLCADSQKKVEQFVPLHPVVVIQGFHQLDEASFFVIDSEEQARKVLAKALSIEDYSRAPTVDYSRYSAIFICHPRTGSLTSLKLKSMEASQNSLKITYSRSWLDQIFVGLNDDVAEAPFLFVVVPKRNGIVDFYQQENGPANRRDWIHKTVIPPMR